MHPDELLKIIYHAMDDKMAADIRILSVDEITALTERFIICTGNSTTQIRAIADSIEEKTTLAGNPPERVEGYISANWILLDFGSVIAHVFHRDMREFYMLEKLWADGKPIDPANL
ncbi:MAG: ribosome silencing factor [Lachnospiraceae bacterium]|nr:ribosome silencing factor [Lachnospiraceae bacterium]